MGTRNVTIIKYNGEERVRQYGQWDGYPTAALASIVNFLKTDGAIAHLKRNVVKCKMIPEDQFEYPNGFDGIDMFLMGRHVYLYKLTFDELITKIVNETKFSKTAALDYYLSTRDTGYQIPNVLITNVADAVTELILKQAYTNECDWQIEAVNIIDLDAERITSYWHDAKREWSFDCLPDETEIEKFEQED